jgi:hypothetical protein
MSIETDAAFSRCAPSGPSGLALVVILFPRAGCSGTVKARALR